MKPVAIVLVLLSMPAFLQRFLRETNSQAASRRGVAAYQKNDFPGAIQQLTTADQLRPSPANGFNLGTAQIAAGHREEGARALDEAMKDASLRPDALYNRGDGALAVKAYDSAVRDYTEALRLRPSDADAKRNLEIALRQLEMKKQQEQKEQQQGAGGGGSGGNAEKSKQKQSDGKPKPDQQQQSKPQRPDAKTPQGSQDQKQAGSVKSDQERALEAILRAIQQQEGEGLQQMKRARAQGQKVGW